MGANKGGKGGGGAKTQLRIAAEELVIAGRRAENAAKRERQTAAGSSQDVLEVVATATIEDIINGFAVAGHTLQTEGALFTLGEGADRLLLTQATDTILARFTTEQRMANIHVFLWHLNKSKEEFNPPLQGEFGEKQRAMHAHLREAFGEEGIAALAARLKQDREDLIRLQAESSPKWVGNNPEVWGGARADIKSALEALAMNSPAYIRVGPDNAEYGVALRVVCDKPNGFSIRVGHVGQKSNLHEKMDFGVDLWCQSGMIPTALNESVRKCPKGDSIEALRVFLWEDGAQRQNFREGLQIAMGRVQAEHNRIRQVHPAPQVKPSAPEVKVPVAALLQPALAQSLAVAPVQQALAPAHVSRRQPQAQHAPVNTPNAVKPANDLVDFMAGLMAAGFEGEELATMVTNYKAAKAKSA